MIRKLHIALTALLVATHAFAVPCHVVSSHGVNHSHADEATEVHVHGDAHAEAEHHEHEAAGLPEVFDASGFGAPHRHAAHAHSLTDHGFSRTRADDMPVMPVVLLPVLAQLVAPSGSLPVEATESPPPKAPHLVSSFLRGPPVC